MKDNNVYDKRVHEAILGLTGNSSIEKPIVLNVSGCYSFGGGIINVDGIASVMPSTLEIIKMQVTVIEKGDNVTSVNIGDILNESQLTPSLKRGCC